MLSVHALHCVTVAPKSPLANATRLVLDRLESLEDVIAYAPKTADDAAALADRGALIVSLDARVPGVFPAPDERRPRALVTLPKGKQLRDLLFAWASCAATEEVLVAGIKREGIKSARKAILKFAEQVRTVEHGKHAQLIFAGPPIPREVSPASLEKRFVYDELTLVSLPGVFASGRVDAGTQMLLAALANQPLGKRILDLGCGCGVIGASLARRGHEVTMVDVDRFAILAAERTLVANELTGDVIPSDVYEGLGRKRFDVIVTNPPFHQGVATDREVAERIIAEAPRRLVADGKLVVVCNRFLPYKALLHDRFANVSVLKEDGRFVVYEASTAIV